MLAENIVIHLRLCSFLGVVPFYNRSSKVFRALTPLPIVVVLVMAIAQIWETVRDVNNHTDDRDVIQTLLQPMFDVSLSLQTIITLNYTHRHHFQQLFNTFNQIDRELLAVHHRECAPINHMRTGFVLLNGIFVLMNSLDFFVYGNIFPLLDQLLYYFGEAFTCYIIHINEFIKILLVYAMWKRIFLLNEVLQQFSDTVPDLSVRHRMLDSLIHVQRNCSDLIDCFNNTYGWNVLLSILQTLIYLLRLCAMLLNLKEDRDNFASVYFLTMWTGYSVIQGVIVATMCEKVVDEGKKTITISYKALYRYSNVPAMREKLLILAQQATARCPQFSAAGFFKVDFSMLFTFVNLITTYVIVIIQFSSNNNNNVNCATSTYIGQ